MTRNRRDLFPSRLERKAPMFERLDPVVHGDEAQRERGPLSAGEVADFERKGFLSFPGYFPAEDMEAFLEELGDYEQDEDLKLSEGVILEPGHEEIRSIFGIHRISERFDRLTRDSRLLGMVEQLLGSKACIHQSRINYKPGFKGKGFNWHSDFETWHAEDGMPRMRCVSFSVALTENNEFNGPLMLVPGSHKYFVPTVGRTPEDNYKSSLKYQEIGVPDEASLRELVKQGGIEAPKGPAGSLTIFECNTLHASNENMSPFPRSNLFFVYNSVENTPDAPYCGNRPRPAFLAEREDFTPLEPVGAEESETATSPSP